MPAFLPERCSADTYEQMRYGIALHRLTHGRPGLATPTQDAAARDAARRETAEWVAKQEPEFA